MQSYDKTSISTAVSGSLELLLAATDTVRSCQSGTAFPTNDLQIGMLCYRTDLRQLHVLEEIESTLTWTLVCDFTQTLLYQEGADALYAAIDHTHADATTESSGFVELATVDEAKAGTDTTRAVTPAGVAAAAAAAAATGYPRKVALLERLLSAKGDGFSGRALDAKPDVYTDTSNIDAALSSGYTLSTTGNFIHNPGTVTPISTWNDTVASSGQIGNTNMQIGFVAPEDTTLESIKVYVAGNPNPGWRTVKLHADNGGVPGDEISDSGWADFLLSTGTGAVTVPWDTPPNLTNGTTYWIVIGPYYSQPTESLLCQTVDSSADIISLLNGSALANNEDWQCEITFGVSGALPVDATVVSTAFEAFTEPTKGFFLALVEPIDVVTYGTDYLASLTLDDGTTWESVAIEKIGVAEIDVEGVTTTVDVVYGEIDFATSGDQTVRSRQQAINSKYIKVHGVIVDTQA